MSITPCETNSIYTNILLNHGNSGQTKLINRFSLIVQIDKKQYNNY